MVSTCQAIGIEWLMGREILAVMSDRWWNWSVLQTCYRHVISWWDGQILTALTNTRCSVLLHRSTNTWSNSLRCHQGSALGTSHNALDTNKLQRFCTIRFENKMYVFLNNYKDYICSIWFQNKMYIILNNYEDFLFVWLDLKINCIYMYL